MAKYIPSNIALDACQTQFSLSKWPEMELMVQGP